MTLPKDLLGLVFWELDSGYDMINFNEINRKCYQLFYENLEVIRTMYRVYTRKKNAPRYQHGLQRGWRSNNKVWYEYNFLHNLASGYYHDWHTDGQLQTEVNFVNDKMNGQYRRWYPNGLLSMSLSIVDNTFHGKCQWWAANGDLRCEHIYCHGELIT